MYLKGQWKIRLSLITHKKREREREGGREGKRSRGLERERPGRDGIQTATDTCTTMN